MPTRTNSNATPNATPKRRWSEKVERAVVRARLECYRPPRRRAEDEGEDDTDARPEGGEAEESEPR